MEIRRGDRETEKVVGKIDDERTRMESECERAFARRIGGDCYVPVGACARLNGSSLTVIGMVASPDGGEVLKRTLTSPSRDAESLGTKLGEEMMQSRGERILRNLDSTVRVVPIRNVVITRSKKGNIALATELRRRGFSPISVDTIPLSPTQGLVFD